MVFLDICKGIGERVLADIHFLSVHDKRLESVIVITCVGDGAGIALINFQITVGDFSVFRAGGHTVHQRKGCFVQTEACRSDDGGSHE